MNNTAVAETVFDTIDTAIGGVPGQLVMKVWRKVEPLLERVVNPQTGWDMKHVLTALQTGEMQLWVIGDFKGVVVTQILTRPIHKVLWIQFISGKHMDEWLDDWITVQEDFARHNDCAAIEFAGRRGWNKISEAHSDYKPILTTIRREL